MSGCSVAINEERDACRLEELTMQLKVSHEVNRHLNGEVEAMVLQVDTLQQDLAAHTRRAEELAELLAREKRERQAERLKAAAEAERLEAAASAAAAPPPPPPQVGLHSTASLVGLG